MGRDFEIFGKMTWGICRFEPNIMEIGMLVVGVINLKSANSI
jgi:hypothetical protein